MLLGTFRLSSMIFTETKCTWACVVFFGIQNGYFKPFFKSFWILKPFSQKGLSGSRAEPLHTKHNYYMEEL